MLTTKVFFFEKNLSLTSIWDTFLQQKACVSLKPSVRDINSLSSYCATCWCVHSRMMLNVHTPKVKPAHAYSCNYWLLSVQTQWYLGFSSCLTTHAFHFFTNGISFTKCLVLAFRWQDKIPLFTVMLRIRQKIACLFGIYRFDSLLGHLFMCAPCLTEQINLQLGRPASRWNSFCNFNLPHRQ